MQRGATLCRFAEFVTRAYSRLHQRRSARFCLYALRTFAESRTDAGTGTPCNCIVSALQVRATSAPRRNLYCRRRRGSTSADCFCCEQRTYSRIFLCCCICSAFDSAFCCLICPLIYFSCARLLLFPARCRKYRPGYNLNRLE